MSAQNKNDKEEFTNLDALDAFARGEEVFDTPRSNKLFSPLPEEFEEPREWTLCVKGDRIVAIVDGNEKRWINRPLMNGYETITVRELAPEDES
jgi:hypothetical protein